MRDTAINKIARRANKALGYNYFKVEEETPMCSACAGPVDGPYEDSTTTHQLREDSLQGAQERIDYALRELEELRSIIESAYIAPDTLRDAQRAKVQLSRVLREARCELLRETVESTQLTPEARRGYERALSVSVA